MVAVHIRVDNGSTFLQSRNRIEDGRKLLVMDINQFERRFGLFQCITRHRRYALTHEPDTILRQYGDVAVAPPIEDSTRVGPGEHGAHAGRFLRAGSIDACNARMSIGAAESLRP